MAKSKLVAVTTGAYVNIEVQTVCSKISVFENGLAGTTQFRFRSSSNDDAVTLDKGMVIEFPERAKGYLPGEVLGAIECVDANANFAQLEL